MDSSGTPTQPTPSANQRQRILFLDDAQLRHDAFAQRHLADDVVHVRTAEQAIRALDESPRFDVAYLDYDLAEEFYLTISGGTRETPEPGDPPYAPGTGMEVVEHIVRMPTQRRPARVIIHSWNPIGREMLERLQRERVPARWECEGKAPAR